MKEPSIYLSATFLNIVWPEFSKGFKREVTKNLYFSDICEFTDYIKKDLLDATIDDGNAFLAHLENQGQKYSTRLKKYRELSSIFTFISKNPYLIHREEFLNPMAQISLEPIDSSIVRESILDLPTLDKLIAYVTNQDSLCLMALILSIKLLLKTSEMVALKKSDFFYDDRGNLCVEVINNTTNHRYLKLPEDVVQPVLNYLESVPDGQYLFYNLKKNTPYTIRTIQNRLTNAFKQIGSKPYSLNEIRNTGIFFCFNSGVSAADIANTIGYKSATHIRRLECTCYELPANSVDLNMVALKFKN